MQTFHPQDDFVSGIDTEDLFKVIIIVKESDYKFHFFITYPSVK
jgi:hypothetical protein